MTGTPFFLQKYFELFYPNMIFLFLFFSVILCAITVILLFTKTLTRMVQRALPSSENFLYEYL